MLPLGENCIFGREDPFENRTNSFDRIASHENLFIPLNVTTIETVFFF